VTPYESEVYQGYFDTDRAGVSECCVNAMSLPFCIPGYSIVASSELARSIVAGTTIKSSPVKLIGAYSLSAHKLESRSSRTLGRKDYLRLCKRHPCGQELLSLVELEPVIFPEGLEEYRDTEIVHVGDGLGIIPINDMLISRTFVLEHGAARVYGFFFRGDVAKVIYPHASSGHCYWQQVYA
jgi:hypothetical protein